MTIQLYDALGKMFENAGTNANKVSKEMYNSNTIQTSKSLGRVMSVANVAKIADHCGFELCLIPSDLVPRCAIPISADQSEPKKDDGVRLGEAREAAISDDMIG